MSRRYKKWLLQKMQQLPGTATISNLEAVQSARYRYIYRSF